MPIGREAVSQKLKSFRCVPASRRRVRMVCGSTIAGEVRMLCNGRAYTVDCQTGALAACSMNAEPMLNWGIFYALRNALRDIRGVWLGH